MPRRRNRAVPVGIALLLTASSGIAAQQKTVSASQAWVKAPAADETQTEAFVVVDNPTAYDFRPNGTELKDAGKSRFPASLTTPLRICGC
jgi:hypothetical protein